MEVQELIIGFGLKIDDKSLENIKKIELGLRSMTDLMSSAGKTFTGGKGITEFFTDTAEAAQELDNLAYSIGWTTDRVQEWQTAIKSTGQDVDSVFGDILQLSTDMRFRMSEAGIIKLMDKLKKASPTLRKEYQRFYGISDAFVKMSAKGSEQFRKLLETAQNRPKLGAEDIKELEEANNKIKDATNSIEKLGQSVISNAAPRVQSLAEKFQKIIDEHPDETINTITASIAALGAAGVISAISTVAASFMKLGAAIKGAAAAAAVLGSVTTKLSGIPLLAMLGKLGWVGAGAAGGSMVWKGGKNLIHMIKGDGKYEKNFLENFMDKQVGLMFKKMGIERGFAKHWPENVNRYMNDLNASYLQNYVPKDTIQRVVQGTTFSGTTININTTQPIGEVMQWLGETVAQTPINQTPINQSSFGTTIYQ